MRIRDETFLCCLTVRHLGDGQIDVYDQDFSLIDCQRKTNSTIEQIEFKTHLPNQIIFKISSSSKSSQNLIELSKIKLVGINISNDCVMKLIEHYPSGYLLDAKSIAEVKVFEAKKSLTWSQGYVITNFFHPDPFALHLFIGNKIKFKE